MAIRGVNKVILVGHMGNAPQVRLLPSGDKMNSFSVATSEYWKDKQSGEMREKTEWHRVSVFGKLAEYIENYASKGCQLYMEGQLQTRKWQDRNGVDRYTTEVVVRWPDGRILITGGRQSQNSAVHQEKMSGSLYSDNQAPISSVDDNFDMDDIPF